MRSTTTLPPGHRRARAVLAVLAALAAAAPATGQLANGNSNPHGFAAGLLSRDVLFAASDGWGTGCTGGELWKTRGTSATTGLVRDIRPGFEGSFPRELTTDALGLGPVWFTADDGASGRELWITDGTPAGTVLLLDIRRGPRGSEPTRLTAVGTRLFFTADDGVTGRELWTSDGTPAGTVMVRDLAPGAVGSEPSWLTAFGTRLYFVADDGSSGAELWSSDGTAGGTAPVLDLRPGPSGSSPSDLAVAGARLFFAADDGVGGRELWSTDGTAGGTALVRDLRPGAGSDPEQLTAVGARVFFTAHDGSSGRELFVSDGTLAGTVQVRDIRPGGQGSEIGELVAGVFEVWFRADDGLTGAELWRSDGTAAGTTGVDIAIGPLGSDPRGLLPFGPGRLLLSAHTPTDGHELWQSDGTRAGTARLADIRPGPLGARPASLFRPGPFFGFALFSAEDSTNGIDLWRTDGTAAGTVMVHDISTKQPLQPEYHVSASTLAGTTTLRFEYGAGAPASIMLTLLSLAPSPPVLTPVLGGPIRIQLPAPVTLPAVTLDATGAGVLAVPVVGTFLGVFPVASQSFNFVLTEAPPSVTASDSNSFSFGGCSGPNEHLYSNGGSYNDETWEYEIPVTSSNPQSGSQGYLGLIHLHYDESSRTWTEQLVRTWGFEPSAQNGTMTVRGVHAMTPAQKSAGDMLQLRYYTRYPSSPAGGCVLFQTYC